MEIRTGRLLLRDFIAADEPAFLAYHADPRQTEFYGPEALGPDHAREIFRLFREWASEQPRSRFQLAITDLRHPQRLLGSCGLRKEDPSATTAEFGLELAPEHWGQGYATEASRALFGFGFRELGLDELRGLTVSGNQKVTALAHRIGLVKIGTHSGSEWMSAQGWEQVEWQLTRERWESLIASESIGMDRPYPLSDLALARRLERTEARANAAFVESRARLRPESGATWIDVAGAYAMFDGIDSPLTQTFGLGLFAEATDAALKSIERFFQERGAQVFHEVSPMADLSLLARLGERGYCPIELSNVLFRPTGMAVDIPFPRNDRLQVRRIEPDEADLWARVLAEGWSSEAAEISAFLLEIGQVNARARNNHCFLIYLEGQPIAAGGLHLGEGVALLAGASTIPSARRQGAQRALLEERLRFAAEQGCPLAMMAALPGSSSQKNAERQGFRIAYTRIKWQLRP